MNELKAVNILLIEDNYDHATLMISTLQEFNVKNTIKHVPDGESAIAYLNHEAPYQNKKEYPTPSIIFLDIRMPRLDGISTLKIIKQTDHLSYIPVVMISTSKLDDEIEECYRLGASGYVSKPLQFEEFARKIKELNHYWVLTAEIPAALGDR